MFIVAEAINIVASPITPSALPVRQRDAV